MAGKGQGNFRAMAVPGPEAGQDHNQDRSGAKRGSGTWQNKWQDEGPGQVRARVLGNAVPSHGSARAEPGLGSGWSLDRT